MSDFLSGLKVTDTTSKQPKFGVLYGMGGCGKSGVCQYAESPFYITLEKGSDWIKGIKRFEGENGKSLIPTNVGQVYDMVRWVIQNGKQEGIKTVVFDSVSFFEPLIEKQVVEDHPTYGKEGYKTTGLTDLGYDGRGWCMPFWTRLLAAVDKLEEKGFDVIFICHATKVNKVSENAEQYKEIDLNLMQYGQHNVCDLLKRRADWVYYMASEINTIKRDRRIMANGSLESDSAIHTRKTSLYYAKSRVTDENVIPDTYYFNSGNRAEVCKKIFEDLNK